MLKDRLIQACLFGAKCSGKHITIIPQKKKKHLKSYLFYHQSIIQQRRRNEIESSGEMRQNIVLSWMQTHVLDIVSQINWTFAHSLLWDNQQVVFEYNIQLIFIKLLITAATKLI